MCHKFKVMIILKIRLNTHVIEIITIKSYSYFYVNKSYSYFYVLPSLHGCLGTLIYQSQKLSTYTYKKSVFYLYIYVDNF